MGLLQYFLLAILHNLASQKLPQNHRKDAKITAVKIKMLMENANKMLMRWSIKKTRER